MTGSLVYFPAPTQPSWQNPNALPARPLKKYNITLNHVSQESRVSAPYASRKTLGSPTRAQATGGRQYLNEPYNPLNDPHLTRYYTRRFESSASKTKLFKVICLLNHINSPPIKQINTWFICWFCSQHKKEEREEHQELCTKLLLELMKERMLALMLMYVHITQAFPQLLH